MANVVTRSADNGNNDDARGALFKDVRVFIHVRVPQRNTFVDCVKRYGGSLARLENQADILIVDHARKDNPTDSYSYTWIEESVREGRLADKEPHRAGPQRHEVRPAGSLRPAKHGRNPYTKEDDAVLYKWVTDHERRGEKALGNEIYKKLEAVNSRHPWQSWRDRWVKYVSNQPPPTPSRHTVQISITSTPDRRSRNPPASSRPASAIPAKRKSPEPIQERPLARTRRSQPVQTNGLPESSKHSDSNQRAESTQRGELSRRLDSSHPEGIGQRREASQRRRLRAARQRSNSNQGESSDRRLQASQHEGVEEFPFDQALLRLNSGRSGRRQVTKSHLTCLLVEARDIARLREDRAEEAWNDWAQFWQSFSAEEWQYFFESEIEPFLFKLDARKESYLNEQSRLSNSIEAVDYSPEGDGQNTPSPPPLTPFQKFSRSRTKSTSHCVPRKDESHHMTNADTPSEEVRYENNRRFTQPGSSHKSTQTSPRLRAEPLKLRYDSEQEGVPGLASPMEAGTSFNTRMVQLGKTDHLLNSNDIDSPSRGRGRRHAHAESRSPSLYAEGSRPEVINLISEDQDRTLRNNENIMTTVENDNVVKVYEYDAFDEDEQENEQKDPSSRSVARNRPEALNAFSNHPVDFELPLPEDNDRSVDELAADSRDRREDDDQDLMSIPQNADVDEADSRVDIESTEGSENNVYSIPPTDRSPDIGDERDNVMSQLSPNFQLRNEIVSRGQIEEEDVLDDSDSYEEFEENTEGAAVNGHEDYDRMHSGRDHLHSYLGDDSDMDIIPMRSPSLPPNDSDVDWEMSQYKPPTFYTHKQHQRKQSNDSFGLERSDHQYTQATSGQSHYPNTQAFPDSDPIQLDLDMPLPPSDNYMSHEQDEVSLKRTLPPHNTQDRSDTVDTQALLQANTFEPDLSMVPPPPSSQSSVYRQSQPSQLTQIRRSKSRSSIPRPVPRRKPQQRTVDTQDLLASNTQLPDLDLPPPPNSSQSQGRGIHNIASSPPTQPSSYRSEVSSPQPKKRLEPAINGKELKTAQGESTSQDLFTPEDLDQFVQSQMRIGYAKDAIFFALDRTTMDSALAKEVLKLIGISTEQRDNRSHADILPRDVKGVWFRGQDEVLLGGDARKMKHVERWHGPERVEARRSWLEGRGEAF